MSSLASSWELENRKGGNQYQLLLNLSIFDAEYYEIREVFIFLVTAVAAYLVFLHEHFTHISFNDFFDLNII